MVHGRPAVSAGGLTVARGSGSCPRLWAVRKREDPWPQEPFSVDDPDSSLNPRKLRRPNPTERSGW